MGDAPDISTLRARLEEAERALAIIRERDRKKSAAYRAKHPEKARESRRKSDRKRRVKGTGKRRPATEETKQKIRAAKAEPAAWIERFKKWREQQ